MAKARIMIVEDERIVAGDVKRILQNMGYAVPAVVSSGEEAIKRAQEENPDLVLMDIVLQGEMDGIEAARKIRSRLDIPVLYLTAYTNTGMLQRAKVTEPFGYIVKPFQERELHSNIEMALYKQKVQRKLKESEQWLSTTLKSIGDGLIATDGKGFVRFMNPVAEALTGWKQEEALGKDAAEVFHIINEKARSLTESPVAKALRNGVALSLTIHELLITKDGTEIPIDGSAAPIRDVKGTIVGVILAFRDITERRKMEEALREAHNELERRVEERTAELSKSNALLKQEVAERKRAEEALQRSERELRRLSSQLLKAQEEERKRIALELHDGIGQSLSAIKFRVEAALEQMGQEKSAKGVKSLEPIVPMAQEALEEVRRITVNLRPSTLDDLGILPTIEWFCREFHAIYSAIRIEKEINIQENQVPDPLKIIIFRVLQEAFNNIGKHSQANLSYLCLGKKDKTLELAIRDNGLGFDLEDVLSGERPKSGLGLTSMKERTELSGGSFAIESARGAGTMIRASWPVRV